ncbi:MAG: NADH pyrophosphatase [Alphaproteobacteria bacterium]|nr:MAG: NADH pyrophosphatase [Alphaproteobacteria bacterium]
MSIDFSTLPFPEPSARTGFAGNRIVRASEYRSEESLPQALADPACRCYLFVPGKAVFRHGETTQLLHTLAEAKALSGRIEEALLLGHDGAEPRLAVPLDGEADALGEPYKAHDYRSLLYGGHAGEADAAAIAQAGSLLHWHATNRFCGKCGSPSRMAIGGYRRDCTACGHQVFPRTDPAVIMLAVSGEKCLLGRGRHFPPGWYSTLAGFVEPGETIEEAVRRETFEESGIRVGRVRYHGSQPWPFPHSLMIGAHGEALNDDIHRDEAELEDCRWFGRDEVLAMLANTHPQGLRSPPSKAIAHSLISAWAAP